MSGAATCVAFGGTLIRALRASTRLCTPVQPIHSFRGVLRPYSATARKMSDEGGVVQRRIEEKLKAQFAPVHLQVINESHMHSVPRGSETHFKVVVVSEKFADTKLIDRHRLVNGTLKEELNGGVHALSIQAVTPQQWETTAHAVNKSPACMGGSKHDAAKTNS